MKRAKFARKPVRVVIAAPDKPLNKTQSKRHDSKCAGFRILSVRIVRRMGSTGSQSALAVERSATLPQTASSDKHPAGGSTDSWYLDPLAAVQKRNANLGFIRRWAADFQAETLVKTDLFEEANGLDRILFDLDCGQRRTLGFDICVPTAVRAGKLGRGSGVGFMAADARTLPLADESVDLIVSTSTLDHFDHPAEFEASLKDLGRVLRPGGRLLLTLDNPSNPTYQVLRLACRIPGAPFSLGYTPSKKRLVENLESVGLRPLGWESLLHNPRLVSTLLFLAMRRTMGSHAEGAVSFALKSFAALERLPTRNLTSCFNAVCAEKL